MQTDPHHRRSASLRRDRGEIGVRAARGQRHQRLARRTAAQLAEAQLEIREWRARPR